MYDFYSGMTVNGMPYYEYKRLHYKPWYLKLRLNNRQDGLSGSYIGSYPSMPLWENEGFELSGIRYPSGAFTLVDARGGTGGGLVCYNMV